MLVDGTAAVAIAMRAAFVVVVGVARLVTVEMVLFELDAAAVDENINGNMEKADFFRPALLL